jgi:carboxyvinyl-carboxyphosphonate phosphorylmutase
MHWTPRREKFRVILAGDTCVNPASVFDAMSARVAENLGFEAGVLVGSIASMTVLAGSDYLVLTVTELAEQAYRINRAGNLLLLVDADHGYGNALNVKRTVEELETSGVAGRTAAVRINGVADAITRAKAYEKAGVDAMFFAGITNKNDMGAIASEVKISIYLGSTVPEINDLPYLSRQGVRIALQGHAPIHAAVQAVHDTLKALRDGTQPADITNVVTGDLKEQILRGGDHKQWLKNFLASG